MNIRLWLCKKLGWHKQPTEINTMFGLMSGTCPICGKEVMMDSHGNWF